MAQKYTSWALVKAYWQSESRLMAYVLLGVVILFTATLVGLQVALNQWYQYFYDALQIYNKEEVIDLLAVFMFIAALFIVFAVYRYYLQQLLGLRWRRWLTEQLVTRWLRNNSYYYLEVFYPGADNPDQRIQEDIGSIVNLSLGLLIGFIGSIGTFCAFIWVLWKLSGDFSLFGVHIHGYLVWAALIYSVIGTYLTFRIGRPLPGLNFEQQRREADFRFAAVDLRSHAENVALYRGEHYEKHALSRLFDKVINIWYAVILRQKLLLWFTSGYNQLSVLIPLIVALPNYFAKVFKLGGLIQSIQAFNQIQEALSFLVNSFTSIAEWRAVSRRLTTLLNHMEEIDEQTFIENKFKYSFQKDGQAEPKITVKDLTLYTPQKEVLLTHLNQEFVHGKNYFLRGPSGLGKSTFIRALAGIWPYGSGEIIRPEHQRIMYLPQKPFMPLGTLHDAILFPDSGERDADMKALLTDCGLAELGSRLHDVAPWSAQLSPGEQQRIAFIRILLSKPDWVFLDESTSALDLEYEEQMYGLLKTRLPHCSLISVGHRPSVAKYHDEEINLSEL